jgi:hypothetical protein
MILLLNQLIVLAAYSQMTVSMIFQGRASGYRRLLYRSRTASLLTKAFWAAAQNRFSLAKMI